jgi:hypothetical protein
VVERRNPFSSPITHYQFGSRHSVVPELAISVEQRPQNAEAERYADQGVNEAQARLLQPEWSPVGAGYAQVPGFHGQSLPAMQPVPDEIGRCYQQQVKLKNKAEKGLQRGVGDCGKHKAGNE